MLAVRGELRPRLVARDERKRQLLAQAGQLPVGGVVGCGNARGRVRGLGGRGGPGVSAAPPSGGTITVLTDWLAPWAGSAMNTSVSSSFAI